MPQATPTSTRTGAKLPPVRMAAVTHTLFTGAPLPIDSAAA